MIAWYIRNETPPSLHKYFLTFPLPSSRLIYFLKIFLHICVSEPSRRSKNFFFTYFCKNYVTDLWFFFVFSLNLWLTIESANCEWVNLMRLTKKKVNIQDCAAKLQDGFNLIKEFHEDDAHEDFLWCFFSWDQKEIFFLMFLRNA